VTAAPPQVLHFVVRQGGARAKVATGSALNGDNTCLQRTRKSRAHHRLGGRGIPGIPRNVVGSVGRPLDGASRLVSSGTVGLLCDAYVSGSVFQGGPMTLYPRDFCLLSLVSVLSVGSVGRTSGEDPPSRARHDDRPLAAPSSKRHRKAPILLDCILPRLVRVPHCPRSGATCAPWIHLERLPRAHSPPAWCPCDRAFARRYGSPRVVDAGAAGARDTYDCSGAGRLRNARRTLDPRWRAPHDPEADVGTSVVDKPTLVFHLVNLHLGPCFPANRMP